MKIRKYYIAIMIGLAIMHASQSAGARDIGFAEDPMKVGMGARPIGMGKAFSAVANDENSLFTNPAGLADMKSWAFSSMYSQLLGDVSYYSFGFVYPESFLKGGTTAIGYLGSSVSGIITPSQESLFFSTYQNNVIIIATAAKANPALSFGFAYKIYSQGFSGSIDSSGVGSSLDMGLRWDIDPTLSTGLTLQNIMPTQMGGFINWANGDRQKLPAVAKIGAKYEANNGDITYAFDSDLQIERRLPPTSHLGAEWRMHPKLSVRAGFDQSYSTDSSFLATNMTFGVGLKLGNLKLDYAYHPYYGESSTITHYVTLSFSGSVESTIFDAIFGGKKEKPQDKLSLDIEITKTAAAPAIIPTPAAKTSPEVSLIQLPSETATPSNVTFDSNAIKLKFKPAQNQESVFLESRNIDGQSGAMNSKRATPEVVEIKFVPSTATESYLMFYKIQTGPFTTKIEAEKQVRALERYGYKAFIKPGENETFLVQTGLFKNSSKAEQFVNELKALGFAAKSFLYIVK